jgi:hypothetical protein
VNSSVKKIGLVAVIFSCTVTYIHNYIVNPQVKYGTIHSSIFIYRGLSPFVFFIAFAQREKTSKNRLEEQHVDLYFRKLIQKKRSRIGSSDGGQEEEVRSKRRLATRRRRHHAQVQGEDRFPAPPTLPPWADQEVILVFVSSPGGRTASQPRPLFHLGQIRR